MRARSLLACLLAASLLAGCAADSSEPVEAASVDGPFAREGAGAPSEASAEPCVTSTPPSDRGSIEVTIYVLNHAPDDACLDVTLEGVPFFTGVALARPAEGSGSRAPHEHGPFLWSATGERATARVTERAMGGTGSVMFPLTGELHLIVYVFEGGTLRVDASETRPTFV